MTRLTSFRFGSSPGQGNDKNLGRFSTPCRKADETLGKHGDSDISRLSIVGPPCDLQFTPSGHVWNLRKILNNLSDHACSQLHDSAGGIDCRKSALWSGPGMTRGKTRRGDAETQRHGAATKTKTKTSPQRTQGAQRTQGKARAWGCFFESKSSQAAKTLRISTQRKRRKQRFFGIVTLPKPFRGPERLLLAPRWSPF